MRKEKLSQKEYFEGEWLVNLGMRLPKRRIITWETWQKSDEEKEFLRKMKGVVPEPATHNPAPSYRTGSKQRLTIYMKNYNKPTVSVYCFAQDVFGIVKKYKDNKAFIIAVDYAGKRYDYNKLYTIPTLKRNMRSK